MWDRIEESTKKLEDYVSDKWKLEVQPGITFDKRTIMRYWDIIDSMDSAITKVRSANFEFEGCISDKKLLSLQMKIRKEKGRIRKNFPQMKWYLGDK